MMECRSMPSACRILAATLLLAVLADAPAGAGMIHDLIGNPRFGAVTIDLRLNIIQAEAFDGTLHLVGVSGGRPAAQRVTLGPTPVASPLQILPSIDSQLSPFGSDRGSIAAVGVFNGQFGYFGQSRSPDAPVNFEATMWDPETGVATALGMVDPRSSQSSILHVGENGLLYGQDSFGAAVYSPTEKGRLPSVVPNFRVEAAWHATPDGAIAVGAAGGLLSWWRATDLATLTYEYVSAEGVLDASPEWSFGGTPYALVFDSPSLGRLLVSEYLDHTQFLGGVAVWDIDTGRLLRDFGLGVGLRDAKLVEDDLVLALNGPDGGLLAALSDGSTLSLASLLGLPANAERPEFALNGLYTSSLGMVFMTTGSGPGGGRVNVYTAAFETNAAVPEPSSLALVGIGMGIAVGVGLRRSRPGGARGAGATR
jgi:hypothetical protein